MPYALLAQGKADMLYFRTTPTRKVSTMPNTATHVLYISDEAYSTLTTQARMLGFIGTDSNTARGMANYVAFIMSCDMQDARPDYIKAEDATLLESRLSPEWHVHTPRVRHRVSLSKHTQIAAAAHCLRLGIAYPSINGIANAPTLADGPGCVAALLEAIGTEWVDVRTRTT